MEHLNFALDIVDDWPPVSSECISCKKVALGYKVTVAPIFIKNLSVNDIIAAEPDHVNGMIFEWSHIVKSARSTVWVMELGNSSAKECITELQELGCNIVKFVQYRTHSIDVPDSLSCADLDSVLKKYESEGIAIAYPSWRHEED